MTEILLEGQWKQIQDYPYAYTIYDYATTSTSDSAYVIGGIIDDGTSGVIARYKNDCWSNIGNLKTSRSSHSAITIGSITMVVGGENINDIP